MDKEFEKPLKTHRCYMCKLILILFLCFYSLNLAFECMQSNKTNHLTKEKRNSLKLYTITRVYFHACAFFSAHNFYWNSFVLVIYIWFYDFV